MGRLTSALVSRDRYRGCLLGLACGDAVGTTVEFMPRGTFVPVTDMVGGGPFGLRAGQWTDDTSMALCLGESLLVCQGFDARDQMTRYLNWWEWGYLSATGQCFDIGVTVREALVRFRQTGDPMAGSTEPDTAGNGSLMRLAPVVLYHFPDAAQVQLQCAASSRTTHGAAEALDCCRLLGHVLCRCLAGKRKDAVLDGTMLPLSAPAVRALAAGEYVCKTRDEIKGSGYAVASLEAALWCFHTTSTFEAAVLAAANLGDDADTTAAITGQIAGAHYGLAAIPARWVERLHLREDLVTMADALGDAARARGRA